MGIFADLTVKENMLLAARQAAHQPVGGRVDLHQERHFEIIEIGQRRADEAGRHQLDLDPDRVEIELQAFTQIDQRGLGRAIGDRPRQAAIAGDR